MPTSTKRRVCAECAKWELGDFWSSSDGRHGVFIETKGWCTHKKNKRKRWNYHPACNDFDKRKKSGFIYCGSGKPTMEDIENIAELTEELIKDNE